MVEPVVVLVKEGELRGFKKNSEVGGSFISFNGIPYAQPPLGDLRFRDPQPLQPWPGVREALNEGPQSVQLDEFSRKIEGDDDCLYLNIATKSLEGSRPVMVWIHGGAFMWGNGGSSIYGPDYLVQKDIVFVSINYRLGVLGFLSLDHEAAPGNMGLKDQVAALKWVKENISQFGGDPNNVTIFGESAGGASVSFHLLSPLSKGFFHKAISQSGVALNPWASAFKTVEIVHRLVSYLGENITDPYEIVEYLRTIPVLKLGEAQENLLSQEEKVMIGFPFGPTVDDKSESPFLPYPAHEILGKGYDVPLLLGYNSHEGIIGLSGFTGEVEKNYHTTVSNALRDLPPSEIPDAAKEIKNFYFGGKRITQDMREEYIQFLGDSLFSSGIHNVLDTRIKTNKSPTYFYRFCHNAPQKPSMVLWDQKSEGSGHADELVFLFHPRKLNEIRWIEPGSTEQQLSERFLRMWTDFARTGNPTPCLDDLITTEWEAATSAAKNYLAIGAEFSAGINPDEGMWQLWKRIKYYY